VFAVNDVMAIGAMTAIRDAGLVPGEDIAVAGFDDISSAVDVAPALTSVVVPLQKIGRTAMTLALREDNTPEVIRISTSVVLRENTPRRTVAGAG
jgi:LacI family transcriptional regulator